MFISRIHWFFWFYIRYSSYLYNNDIEMIAYAHLLSCLSFFFPHYLISPFKSKSVPFQFSFSRLLCFLHHPFLSISEWILYRVCVCVCVRVKRKGKKLLVIIIMFEKLVLQSHKTKTNQRMNLRRTEYFPVRNEWFIRYISVFHSYLKRCKNFFSFF